MEKFAKIIFVSFSLLLLIFMKSVNSSGPVVIQVPNDPRNHKVYWNVPTEACKKFKVDFKNLYQDYGIIQNTNDDFIGDKIVIMYDKNNGAFPTISGGSQANGGIPQNGNLTQHFFKFKQDIDRVVPNKKFDGPAVIDMEQWRPILRQHWGNMAAYKNMSWEEVKNVYWWLTDKKSLEEKAAEKFEDASRVFMGDTLSLAKYMRPHAKWGYYGYPMCYNMRAPDIQENCPNIVQEENDKLTWLWKGSGALYPSVYFETGLTSEDEKIKFIRGRVTEAQRVSDTNTPIYPYFSFVYSDQSYLSPDDLDLSLDVFHKANTDGLVIWGSSSSVNTYSKCLSLQQYLTNVLGPAVDSYTKLPIYKTNGANKMLPSGLFTLMCFYLMLLFIGIL